MSRDATKPAYTEVSAKGDDRPSTEGHAPGDDAPPPTPASSRRDEKPTRVQPLERPGPPAQRPEKSLQPVPASGSLTAELTKLSLLERFDPEPRDLQPPLITPGINWQNLHDRIFDYFRWRMADIAYAVDSTIAYVGQIDNVAQRITTVTLNAIVNKLIIGNRTDGLNVAALAAPIGPPKGFLFPSVAASIITAIGKTSPIWSGDQYFLLDLGNAVPVLNDHAQNPIANLQVFPAAPNVDILVERFCSAGKIPMRSVDWKIPGGTPHWLIVLDSNNGRTNALVAPDVHPDNFDPPNTVLAALTSCTGFAVANCRYVIMKGVSDTTIWSLISTVYEV